jgi:hypothetical protein
MSLIGPLLLKEETEYMKNLVTVKLEGILSHAHKRNYILTTVKQPRPQRVISHTFVGGFPGEKMDNLHVRLNFNLSIKEKGIKHNS